MRCVVVLRAVGSAFIVSLCCWVQVCVECTKAGAYIERVQMCCEHEMCCGLAMAAALT